MVLHHDDEVDLGHWVWHVVLPFIVGLLFILVAFGFLLGVAPALPVLAFTQLLCLMVGLRNTWILMVWIILRQAPDDDANQDTSDAQLDLRG